MNTFYLSNLRKLIPSPSSSSSSSNSERSKEHDYLDFVLTPTTLNMYNLRLDVTRIEGCIRAGKRHLGPIRISAPKRFIHVVLEGPEHGTETADSESLDASDSEFFWASPRMGPFVKGDRITLYVKQRWNKQTSVLGASKAYSPEMLPSMQGKQTPGQPLRIPLYPLPLDEGVKESGAIMLNVREICSPAFNAFALMEAERQTQKQLRHEGSY